MIFPHWRESDGGKTVSTEKEEEEEDNNTNECPFTELGGEGASRKKTHLRFAVDSKDIKRIINWPMVSIVSARKILLTH